MIAKTASSPTPTGLSPPSTRASSPNSGDDKNKLEDKVAEIISWLEDIENAEMDEYEFQHKGVEKAVP